MATEEQKAARKLYLKLYYERNRERLIAVTKTEEYKIAQRIRQKRYADANRERCRSANRKWNNSDVGRKTRTAWAKSDVGKAWFLAEHHRKRKIVLTAYGSACAHCGKTDLGDGGRHLVIDHVYGGGPADREAHGNGTVFYNRIIREGFPADYRVLCYKCNLNPSVAHVRGRSDAA